MSTAKSDLRARVARHWQEYAIPHICEETRPVGDRRGIRMMRERAWMKFSERCRIAFRELQLSARNSGQQLDFQVEHLQQLMLRGLQDGCALCGNTYGAEEAAVVWTEHPSRFRGLAAKRYGYRLRNLLPACGPCAAAIGLLSASVWRDVLNALAAEPDWIAARYIAILGGRRVLPKAGASE